MAFITVFLAFGGGGCMQQANIWEEYPSAYKREQLVWFLKAVQVKNDLGAYIHVMSATLRIA